MKKMKVLFYGFRHYHIYTLYEMFKPKDYVEIVACIEEDDAARERAVEKLGIQFSSMSYEDALKEDIDVVAIGGRYGVRGEAIIKALKAGKHIIADKPVCTSLEELDEIEKLAFEKGLKVGCMYDLRYIAPAVAAKKLLESGKMGEVYNVAFDGQHCIDYENRPAWYFEENMHGGTINDLSIHGIDLVSQLTNLEIESVDSARVWNKFAYKNPDFKDCAYIMARFKGGASLIADASYAAPSQVFSMPTYWNFKFWCKNGLINFNCANKDVTVYENGKTEPTIIPGETSKTDLCDDFFAEITNDTTTFTTSVIKATRTALKLQKIADTYDNSISLKTL